MRDDWKNPQLSIRLIELHADKDLSFRMIAEKLNAEFGTTLTRYACIGRSHRLKLEKRPFFDLYLGYNSKDQAPPPPGKRKMMLPVTPIAPLEEYGPRRPEGVTFEQLDTYRECRWPYGEALRPAKYFCGKPMMEGSPAWCEEHHHKVYVMRRY